METDVNSFNYWRWVIDSMGLVLKPDGDIFKVSRVGTISTPEVDYSIENYTYYKDIMVNINLTSGFVKII